MVGEILTRCGYRCDLCLAYAPNVKKHDQRQLLSDGWHTLYGFRIPPEEIVCEGCVSCEHPVLIDTSCPVRPCVISRGIDNCAHCDDYVCDKLKQRIVNRGDRERAIGRALTDQEYKNFVEPYDSKPRLDVIRKTKTADS